DEGVSGISTPAAGWPTTIKIYSNCNGTASASQTFTTYTAYDLYSNVVGTVDPFGAANSSIYGSKGCVLSTAPVALSPAWTAGHYTSCSVYDAYGVQATSQSNALGQTNSVAFDDNQGRLPTSATDVNGQTTSVSYSIDSNQNQTLQVKQPGETGNFTSQSSTNSTCVFSSTRPCYEIDGFSSLYPNAVSRTFYDSLGRATETRTPLDASHDLVTFTVYNEWNDSKFESQPFRVASGSNWIDPNGATDDQGNTPTGTITITDPLGRVVATRDAIEGTSAEPGIPCNNVSGTWTTCVSFALGSPDPNSSALYDYAVSRDANNHRTVSFADALGRIRFVKTYSANGSINANITSVTETQYNALNEATSVIVTDAAPQSGQSVTSVTTTATYDDMGRLTGTNDPDRGSHSYSYDADSGILTDISGTRTLGVSYDLLGRVRCVQDAAPTTDGSGSCSSGSHPLVQNSYDTSLLQLSGTTNYITGRLGQSIATTYYPDGSSVSTTEQFEYDQRGRLIAGNEQLSVPSGWNVSTPLPTYQKHLSYNDDDQLTMTQTTVGGATGYTFTQVYDSTTGKLTGLSNNSTGAANLASLGYNVNGLISDINFMTTTGTVLANNHITYDGDLRPVGANATWQGGSGTTGTIFSTSRNYDPVGNVISAGLTHAAISGQSNSGGSEAQNFCYDELNRMVWAGNSGTQPGAGNGTCGSTTLGNTLQGAAYNNSYVYTHLGQIWQAPLGGTGSVQQDLYCNSSHPHQLTGVYPTGTTCSTTSGATAAYSASYDSWGNMTARTYKTVSATLSYDVLDHLVQWNSTDSSNAINNRQEWYAYDGSGNRVLRRSSSGGTTSITTYAFGLEEHSYGALGNTTGNTYYYTLSGRLIGQFDGTNTRCLLTDELGSVLATFSNTAGSAAVLANQAYGPYGNKQYSAGTMGTNKGYTGQYSDGTGLNYYGARYYDPVVGRFISADIIQGNEAGMDPYDYVGGNPETFNDPTGLAATNGSPGSISCFSSVLLPGSICGEGQLPNPLQGDNIGPDINASGSDLIGPGMPNIGNDLSGIANVLEKMIQQALQVVGQMQQELQNQVNKTQDTPAHPQATQPLIITNQGKVDNASAVAKVPAVKNVAANTGTGCGGLSFAADTQVSTPQGSQAISTLQVGDHVQAYDPTTRTVSTQTVLNVFINHDSDLIDVTLAMKPQGTTTTEGTNKPQQVAVKSHGSHVPTVTTEKVHTTQNHPWLTTKGWVTAGNLHLGDQVQQLDRKTATVVALKVILGSEDMYDLTVSNVHTFAVGSGQLVVHNSGCDSNGNPGAVEIAKDLWQKTLNEGGNLTSATLAVGVKNDGTLLVALNQRALEGKLANSGLRTLRDPAVEALQKVIQRYRGVLYVGPTNLVQSYAEDLPHAEDFIREAVKPGELAGIGAYPSEICVRCFIRLDETQHQATSYFVLNEGGE
ncbi:MAG TPA: RHS repeat-associated core domain-containing protein, partial [Ktedonobacteraceae bacterium]|nr:RHS repeat-associated core domain-containing protein [Ktedonobacteraceae bacterium]